jgi:hypothetical protein
MRVPTLEGATLLHRDPDGRYTVLAMVWERGQGTPLHDHAGRWCVECVYQGRIRVTSYSVRGDPERDLVEFRQESVVLAGIGEAGALIPPFEYHRIQNPDARLKPRPTITWSRSEMSAGIDQGELVAFSQDYGFLHPSLPKLQA